MPTRCTSFVVISLAFVLTACGGGFRRTGSSPKAEVGDNGPAQAEVSVANVTREQALQLVKELDDWWEIENVKLRTYADGVAVYDLEVRSEAELPVMVAKISTPGLKYQGRQTQFRYAAFDNVPPRVTFMKPVQGAIFRERETEAVVEVADADIAEVTLNGTPMQRSGMRFSLKVPLREGANDLVVVAKDATGNEGRAQVRVGLDSTPPDVTAEITVIIEGDVEPGSKVFVDGSEVRVDGAGHYEAKVRVKRGQREIEVVAVDTYGNRRTSMRPLGD